jgi:hypothetical protein
MLAAGDKVLFVGDAECNLCEDTEYELPFVVGRAYLVAEAVTDPRDAQHFWVDIAGYIDDEYMWCGKMFRKIEEGDTTEFWAMMERMKPKKVEEEV